MRDYIQTRRKLSDQKEWDIPGVIDDVRRDLLNADASAVIDVLMEAMADICKLIHHKHAICVDTDTLAKAANIAAKFVREPK